MNEIDYDKNGKKEGVGKLNDIYALMDALMMSPDSGYIKKSRKRWTDVRVSKRVIEMIVTSYFVI